MEVEGVTAEQMKSGIQNINSAKDVENQMGLRRQKQMAKEVVLAGMMAYGDKNY